MGKRGGIVSFRCMPLVIGGRRGEGEIRKSFEKRICGHDGEQGSRTYIDPDCELKEKSKGGCGKAGGGGVSTN